MICGITFTCGCGRWFLVTSTAPAEAVKHVKRFGWLKDRHGQLVCSKECLRASAAEGEKTKAGLMESLEPSSKFDQSIVLNSRGGCA